MIETIVTALVAMFSYWCMSYLYPDTDPAIHAYGCIAFGLWVSSGI